MTNFNYEKAYCVQALPAFNNLNEKQHDIHSRLLPLIGELNQGKDLNIPISPAIAEHFDALTCKEIAELSRASFFVGHWQPVLLSTPFNNKKRESWKIANVCDQILRSRLTENYGKTYQGPHNIQIHEGKFRVIFSSKNCWMWEEFGLATEKNLEIFKNCGLPFGENSLHTSAEKLTELCGEMRPDVDDLPENDFYRSFLEAKKAAELNKLKQQHTDKITSLKRKIEYAQIELTGFEWLINHHIDYDNCIYYDHTGRFCFGWRNALTKKEKAELAESLREFPFPYDFK